MGLVILRNPCLLLLFEQNLGEKPVNLFTHLFVRSLLLQVPALISIEMSEPLLVELSAFGYLGPELEFQHRA